MTHTWARVMAATGLAVALAGVGCADSGDREDSGSAHETDAAVDEAGGGGELDVGTEAPAEESAEGAVGGASDADGGAAAQPTALELTAQARDVVRTGSMHLTVDEVDDRVPEVRSIAVTAGGFVADEQLRSDADAADVTVRVPADEFDDVRTAIGELGDVTSQDIQAQDVTAEMVDLEGRIASQRASVQRVRALLSESGDVVQLASVEGELARREAELESLLGQQRVLEDQVALGTLTVHLREDGTAPAEADDEPTGFMDGLRTGWDAAVVGARAASAAAGFLLPFAVPAAVVLAAARWWLRRRQPLPTPPAGTEVAP
jgi:Domain of unknown function (DUF4349)